MELAWVLFLVVCHIPSGRLQATVDINPQKNIPGIGALLGGEDEKPVLQRWQFWLGIGLAAAFSIVVAYFIYRGFKNHAKMKEERRKQQEIEEEEEGERQRKQEAEGKTLEHDIENPPLSALESAKHPSLGKINVDELARRTGRSKKDILASHVSHHHHRSTSNVSSATAGNDVNTTSAL